MKNTTFLALSPSPLHSQFLKAASKGKRSKAQFSVIADKLS